jgi:beta-phosphoglucomutase-like phosphatase (HAD superfamily)
LKETVFLDLDNVRYEWENIGNDNWKITTSQIETLDFSIGTISENLTLKLNLKIKVLFLDLGNTLVSRPNTSESHTNTSEKFVAFPETDTILSKLKGKGLEIAVISDGNRSDLTLLADPTILDRFKVIVMSGDDEVGGIQKPKAKIFNIGISKMSKALGFPLDPTETAFLTENVEHFKAYNFLYTLGLKEIIADDCRAYVD